MVNQIIQALYGVAYTPTGMYSFEFFDKRGDQITEIFFFLPPETVSVSESQRAELIPTLRGGYYCDFGNEFKDISIQGSCHFFYATGRQNGFNEFLKLRFMVSRYRDYTMTDDYRLIAENFGSEGNYDTDALKSWVEEHRHAIAEDIDVVFHDYDYGEHYYVKVDRLRIDRDKSDPFTVRYDIALKAYMVFRRDPNPTTPDVKRTTPQKIFDINAIMNTVHSWTLPIEIPSYSLDLSVLAMPTYTMPTDPIAEVIQDQMLNDLNEHIRDLRELFAQASGAIQTGTVEVGRAMQTENGFIDDQMKTAITEMLDALELKYIPSTEMEDFLNGDIVLQDFAPFDVLEYYGETLTLQLISYGMTAAMALLPESSQVPVAPTEEQISGSFVDVLSDDEFVDQSATTPVVTSEGSYRYHTVVAGETLMSISQKYYGTAMAWTFIAQANKIYQNDLIDSDLIGTVLKIPVLEKDVLTRAANNHVYEPKIGSTYETFIRYLLGSDIDMEAGKIAVDASGDLRLTGPVDGLVSNLLDRINNIRGSLNPLHPGWGMTGFNVTGGSGIPYVVQIDRIIRDLEEQLKNDPRVKAASVDLSKLRIDGDALYVDVKIKVLGGITTTTTVKL